MGCSNCGPEGCGNNGHCSSGGCNRMNTYDWISTLEINDPEIFDYVEVSFKNGARKEFYKVKDNVYQYTTGDMVLVECSPGYDVGQITLMGELVRMQMKKKSVSENRISNAIIRKANDRDLEKLSEGRMLEKRGLARARAIARTLGLDMKLGDIEYQGDLKKATFYYTANGRVDFRELVKEYAKEFRIKIEMRQIGSRQESARLGGLGSCGRELCCSTWLSDFKSVNTAAARYQNIAINQIKLTGQCGRLKCCLNYELDTYLDALKDFPKRADKLKTKQGNASLVKTDIFKGLMFYVYDDINIRGAFHPIDKDKVKEILALNAKGVLPEDLMSFYSPVEAPASEVIEFEDVTGVIELPSVKKSNRKKKSKGRGKRSGDQNQPNQRKNNKRPNSKDQNSKADNTSSSEGNKEDKTRQNKSNKNRNRPNNNQNRKDNKQTNATANDKSNDSSNALNNKEDNRKRSNNRNRNRNRNRNNRNNNNSEKNGNDKPTS